MKKLFLLIFFVFSLFTTQFYFGQIYVHNFGTATTLPTANNAIPKPYTVPPSTLNSNLSSSSWTTSKTAFTGYAGAGADPTSQALGLSNSSGTPTMTLTFNVNSGFNLSVTSFSFWRRRSTTGAQNWSMSINGISVGSGSLNNTNGASTGTLNVTNPVNNLTGTITVVLSLSSASGTGTFRIDDFTLNGNLTANNPNCSALSVLSLPTTIGSSTSTGSQTTCGMVNDFPVGSFGSTLYGGGEDAVYQINVPSGGGNYQFNLGGSGTYKILSLHSSCTPTSGNVIKWSTTSSGTSTSFSQNLAAGTYYLWTDTWPSPTCGNYSITVTKLDPPPPPPANDEPSGAILLTVNDLSGYQTYSNVSATNTTTESSPTCALYSGEDVWFKVVVPNNITILDFDTQTGGITDGGMSIYRGAIGSLTQIECDDDDGLDGAMPWIFREDFIPGETIYIRFWEYGGGTTGTFKIFVSTPQALPVELTKFDAIPYPQLNIVNWVTASENNSSHFDLEMSLDGEEWRKLTTVPSAGNSTEELKYSFINYNSNPLTYYRLQQFDIDGKFKTYGPIMVTKTITDKKIVKHINLMGQEVNPDNVTGVILEIYDDGTMKKMIR